MEALGIGDLHLDGPLTKYIPELNSVILDEVDLALQWGVARGIKLFILYGDIGHRPKLSEEATSLLLSLFAKYSGCRFLVLKGNHDTKSDEENGLTLLHHLTELELLKNVKFVLDKPQLLFKNTDSPIYLLPWPYSSTKAGVLNILHTEVNGAKWDTGREVQADNKVNTKHLSVIGHIHTSQRVGNAHFSGTLYQTSFGEKPEKFFHHIDWTGDVSTSKIRLVPHVPKYRLQNVVLNSKVDLKQLPTEPTTLVKVFVNKDLILPADVFDKYPNVVKSNLFGNPTELKALMKEELELEDISGETRVDLDEMLSGWMKANEVSEELQLRVPSVLDKLLTKVKNG